MVKTGWQLGAKSDFGKVQRERVASLKFIIDSIVGPHELVGRNDKTDIPIGSVFTRVTKTRFEGEPLRPTSVDLGLVLTLSLELVDIELYGLHPDFVAGGYTALLTLKGDGFAELSELLAETRDREHLILEVP